MDVDWSRVSVCAWLESVQVGSVGAQKVNSNNSNNSTTAIIAEETSLLCPDLVCMKEFQDCVHALILFCKLVEFHVGRSWN